MTTLENRPSTALLVIDVQNGVVQGAYQRDAAVANIGVVVEKARQAAVSVIWIQNGDDQLVRGSAEWQIVPELAPLDTDTVIDKSYSDSFEETGLEDALAKQRVGRLVVVGAQTDECVRSKAGVRRAV
jgi:nicotinamidase-related amidase